MNLHLEKRKIEIEIVDNDNDDNDNDNDVEIIGNKHDFNAKATNQITLNEMLANMNANKS